ncbi:MAG: efflux RND transporter permease subunit [Nitrospina sp.]|jgi:copper/silver efflux system protein|nr:efflux RND transporter permease subunit [Nitrospina sp.]MBT4050015.1 efflux RND transporter permease subunit [Nitrospina sp.]MBT4556585.1 efflux RND transporter permease subunit [Nitrospina sp.]MBT5348085.1 efflux RND transporter permease subunit [Nitrospina sp.]MBT5652206.1 efflux RND transporter permease subunit [Nitrospina sp.]
MIKNIIGFSLKNRFLVLFATVFVIAWGSYSLSRTPLDAIPDLSDVQVIIFTKFPGQAPQIVEDQITYPLTTAMLSVPYAKVVRGYSFFGLSFVYIIFEDGTDMYWARSRVLEQLNFASGRLPPNISPTLGPDATGVGWVFEYALVDNTGTYDLSELRSIQDWYLRYELQTVPGVSEVASIGGYVRQYQVEVDPNKLAAYNLPLHKVVMAIKRSNNDVGGRLLEMAETEFMVRGLGYIKNLEDLKNISLGVDEKGTPVLVRDIARVRLGPELRRGIVDLNGEGEVVGGVVIQRFGENALQVIQNVKKKLESLKAGLPKGVEIVPVYDRSGLIERAVDNLKEKLIEEVLAVSAICILFLLHIRSALVAIVVIPLSVLMAFIIMNLQGLNANIMSLGGIAIAIGALIDGAIVMIENAHKHLAKDKGKKNHWQIIYEAATEVGPALFFSLLIMTTAFLPVFTLQAQEGRLFTPMAFTWTYSLLSAALLAITLVPVLMGYFIRGRILPEKYNPLNLLFAWLFKPIIWLALRLKLPVIIAALVLTAATWIPLERLGSEFMPPLNEGDVLYMPNTLPGISITKAKELLQQTDKIIKTFPEVHHVFGKIGRAETATDTAPLSMLETSITMKPRVEWREGMTHKKLVEEMDAALKIPGVTNIWTMPIKNRIDMLSTGIKTPVGIKISGNDLSVLEKLGKEVEILIKNVPGTMSVFSERVVGGNYFDFEINREEASRYGLSVGDIQDVIQTAIGGMNVSTVIQGLERYPINVRYPSGLRDDWDELQRVLIPTPGGEHIPMAQVAKISIKKGPPVIKTENARLNAWVYIDLKDIDIGTYVENAKRILNEKLTLPPGYSLIWSGQFEYMERAKERLKLVVPLTLVIIFVLLYLNFQHLAETILVMLSLPLALIGGVWVLYYLQYELSVAVAVGFIALAGVAAEIGVLILVYCNQEFENRLANGSIQKNSDVLKVVFDGTSSRIRPIMMTVISTIGGLIPIMIGTGTGTEVMKRIAAPMVGGMVSATLLNLIVLPALYAMVLQFRFSQRGPVIENGYSDKRELTPTP